MVLGSYNKYKIILRTTIHERSPRLFKIINSTFSLGIKLIYAEYNFVQKKQV
jgi:hypothetical protein